MKKPLLALALLALGAALCPAQLPPTPEGARSDEILRKVARLDSLIQLVPLNLTKEQMNPILSAIEKERQKLRELQSTEAKDLVGLDAKVSKAVDDGQQKNVYPPRDLQVEVAKMMRALGIRRQMFNGEMVDMVYGVCKNTLNEGQLKVMEKSLKPELLDPSLKGVDMDSEARIKFFIRKILLDPVAYDVLREMYKRTEDPAPATPPSDTTPPPTNP